MSASVAIRFSLRGVKQTIDGKGGKEGFDKTTIYQILKGYNIFQ